MYNQKIYRQLHKNKKRLNEDAHTSAIPHAGLAGFQTEGLRVERRVAVKKLPTFAPNKTFFYPTAPFKSNAAKITHRVLLDPIVIGIDDFMKQSRAIQRVHQLATAEMLNYVELYRSFLQSHREGALAIPGDDHIDWVDFNNSYKNQLRPKLNKVYWCAPAGYRFNARQERFDCDVTTQYPYSETQPTDKPSACTVPRRCYNPHFCFWCQYRRVYKLVRSIQKLEGDLFFARSIKRVVQFKDDKKLHKKIKAFSKDYLHNGGMLLSTDWVRCKESKNYEQKSLLVVPRHQHICAVFALPEPNKDRTLRKLQSIFGKEQNEFQNRVAVTHKEKCTAIAQYIRNWSVYSGASHVTSQVSMTHLTERYNNYLLRLKNSDRDVRIYRKNF